MKTTCLIFVAFAFAALAFGKHHKSKDGFVSLYNGKDLTGWKTTGNWIPQKDGSLLIQPRPGEKGWQRYDDYLTSVKKYKDFILEVEYKYPKGGNSGVYFRRAKAKEDRKGPSYQLNLGRGEAGEFVGLFLDRWLDKGDDEDRVRKPREWNEVRLLVVGSRIRAWLNGELIVDHLDPDPRPDLARAGTIALQTYGAEGHAGWVKFRKMRIRKIP